MTEIEPLVPFVLQAGDEILRAREEGRQRGREEGRREVAENLITFLRVELDGEPPEYRRAAESMIRFLEAGLSAAP